MKQDENLNTTLAWVLRTAVTIAFFITLTGYILFLATKSFDIPSCRELGVFPLTKWLHSGWGLKLAATGILGFIAVPVSRVVYSAWYFSKHKNPVYAALSFYVLLMVGVGILVGVTA